MITGFNTDVEYEGRIYHVQTEDKGLANPVVESLVYTKGEILTSRRTSYETLAESGQFNEDEVLSRMEAQHQSLIREICNGKFDNEVPKPFGHNIISNRSLDEVALEYLIEHVVLEPIKLRLLERHVFYEGSRPAVQFEVLEDGTDRPIQGADVRVKLVSIQAEPRELFCSRSDRSGRVDAAFDIPPIPGGADAAILCEAELLGRKAQIRQMVERAKAPT